MPPKDLRQVSASPTIPLPGTRRQKEFDVADLYEGPEGRAAQGTAGSAAPLDEKLRQAYYWIVNHAIITPYYDMEFNDAPPRSFRFGGAGTDVRLPTESSFSSFVLLPLLTFAARKRALFVGGPGRGKTASALLMGILAGYSLKEMRRAMQHGQPQMTVADLLGSPLPRDLIHAEDVDKIRIGWRKWISMRVKIVDEYNRIPTRTQSALLTLLGDGYAEVLGQTIESPESAWFLTANDDAGGGTYQVIEALKDRIDLVIKALNFNPRFLGDLQNRIEDGVRPENLVPREIVFSEKELEAAHATILKVPIPRSVRRRIEFFAAQFDFCDLAAQDIEYKSKDTIHLAGRTLSQTCAADCGRDKVKCLCSQTENGLSVRSLMTLLSFTKTLAWFRGRPEAGPEDVRQILPFVLHEKLQQNATSPYFNQQSAGVYRIDRVGWLRRAWDLSCEEFVRLNLDRDDPVAALDDVFERGLDGVKEDEVRKQLNGIEGQLEKLAKGTKLYAHVQADVLKLKYYHQRYSNYLRWLRWEG
ncbi:MAG: AAA family ATPase [Candidatus Brocadiae bacterium]|nr:AAA family ATPase [Candidatus Brocadiia bacterium]